MTDQNEQKPEPTLHWTTLNEMWDFFQQYCLPQDLPEESMQQIKTGFFGGAKAMTKIILQITTSVLSDEDMDAKMTERLREIDEFSVQQRDEILRKFMGQHFDIMDTPANEDQET